MNVADTVKFLESGNDVPAQVEAFEQLNQSVSDADLPALMVALESTSSFWVRELLAEPVIRLAGAKALPQLMKALRKNYQDGHDNDGFETFLVELAESDSANVRAKLEKLARTASRQVQMIPAKLSRQPTPGNGGRSTARFTTLDPPRLSFRR